MAVPTLASAPSVAGQASPRRLNPRRRPDGWFRTCPGCQRAFVPKRTSQMHCRPACRTRAWRLRRVKG